MWEVHSSDKIRIKDIAERSGVSVGTVDRVLHNRPNVSGKARAKVEAVLKEINYQPNMYASALAYNRKYTFCCLLPDHDRNAYWTNVEKGLQQIAGQGQRSAQDQRREKPGQADLHDDLALGKAHIAPQQDPPYLRRGKRNASRENVPNQKNKQKQEEKQKASPDAKCSGPLHAAPPYDVKNAHFIRVRK